MKLTTIPVMLTTFIIIIFSMIIEVMLTICFIMSGVFMSDTGIAIPGDVDHRVTYLGYIPAILTTSSFQ